MKINTIFMATAITAATIFTGCSSPAENAEEADSNMESTKENLDQAESDYYVEVEIYKKETNEKISANEQLIADFKKAMKDDKNAAKAEYKEQIAALEQKNSEMKKRMNEYKDDGKEKWQSFKTEFGRDMEELGQSLKDFAVDNEK